MTAIKTKKAQNLIMRRTIKKSLNDPAWFYENVLNFPALDWQIEGTQAVFDVRRKLAGHNTVVNHKGLPRITVRSCHGPGKTQWLGMLSHIWNFTTLGKIAVTAPKEAQLTRRYLPRYRRCMRDAPKEYKDNISTLGKEILIGNDKDHGVVLETASDPDNLSGFHDDPQLFLIDEASARRLDPMFPVVDGALTTPGSVVVEIGNPTRMEGEFYNHHNKPGVKELYYKMHIKHSDARKLIPQSWVNAMAQKYGVDSPIYLIRVAGEFASYDELILIPPEFIDDALNTPYKSDGSHPQLKISIDVADGGADSTTITAALHYADHVHVIKQKQFHFSPSVAVIESAQAAIEMFNGFGGNKIMDTFIVDAIGVGAGTAGYLMKEGYNVVRNVGGESSDDANKWRNRRVQNYIALYNAFMEGSLTIEPDAIDDEEEFTAHLLSIKRNEDNEKVDDIEPKKKIKQNGQPSPDRADSLSMQYNGEIPTADSVIVMPTTIGTLESASYDAGLT